MNDPARDRQRRFTALWQRLGASHSAGSDGARVHAELENLYAEPQRHYHTMRHITHCLAMLDTGAELAVDGDVVELAVWFHDAIYVPGAPDNEARSADLAAARAGGVLEPARRDHLVELIMATVHPSVTADPDAQLLSDVDLSGFGLPRATFLRDSVRVRRELGHLSLAQYWVGQRAFLHALVAQRAIYATPLFHERLEGRARANISAYRAAMERRLPVSPPAGKRV